MTDASNELFELFAAAEGLGPDARGALVADVARRDRALARELELLLAEDEREGLVPREPTDSSGPAALAREALAGVSVDRAALDSELDEISSCSAPEQRYELGAELGRGSMGQVRRAWDRGLRRELAIKTIRTDRTKSGAVGDTLLGRFLNEARITARLDHPGVVPVHDIGVDGRGEAYFTMRAVRGRDLAQVFELAHAHDTEWTKTRVLGVLLRVCETMAYAHSQRVIHRDLKPANIMVGEFGVTYVMDWGVARVLGEPDERDLTPAVALGDSVRPTDTPLVTRDGAIVGTPYFMPPEQARGEVEGLDQRADVYAVGAMLYELLSERRPYQREGDSASAVLERIVSGAPEPLEVIAPDTPPELVAICEKAMASDAAARYADMGVLAADLRAYQENRVVLAHRTGPVVELRKWIRRNRAVAALSAGALLLVVSAAVTFALIQAGNARRERELSDHLRLVADFQGQHLARADPALMGRYVYRELLDKARAREERSGASPAEIEATVAELNRLLDGLDFSGLAVGTLEEQIFVPAIQAIDLQFAELPLVQAQLLQTLAETARELGLSEFAIEPEVRALAKFRAELGDEDERTIECLLNLGSLLRDRGRVSEAEPLLAKALDSARRQLGEEHALTLSALNNMGVQRWQEGRHEEAEEYMRQALETSRRVFGNEDTSTIDCLSFFGGFLEQQGRLSEAEPLLRAALEASKSKRGDDHPHTLLSRVKLGRLLHAQGRPDDGEPLLREALRGARRVLGDEHPYTLSFCNYLGVLLVEGGTYAEAERLLVEALNGNRRVLGDRDPYTRTCASDLVGLYDAWHEAQPEAGHRSRASALRAEFGGLLPARPSDR